MSHKGGNRPLKINTRPRAAFHFRKRRMAVRSAWARSGCHTYHVRHIHTHTHTHTPARTTGSDASKMSPNTATPRLLPTYINQEHHSVAVSSMSHLVVK